MSQNSVTQALLAGGDRQGVRLAATALLSQTHPDMAAATLASAYPGSPHSLFQHLRALGEDELAESMARDWLTRHPTASSEGIEQLVTEASAQERVNGPAAAMSVLEHAWEQTACLRAEIADRLAELAERSGDLVLAAEARQKAQAEVPSVDRRAHAALALIESSKIDEGLGLVPQSTVEPMDLAVIGLAYLADNRPGEAETYLTRAAEAMAAGPLPGPEWLGRITHALLTLGNPSHAASVARLWVDTAPGNLDARTSLAAALHKAGDENSAAAQAGWLLAMDPTQDVARQVLAESLQAVGRPGDALEHWQSLALTNAKALKPLIECALEADDLPVAKHQASRWLALDPESPQALVMYGRTLTASGELDAARDHLQLATERSPQSPETWLALVEAQRAMGNSAVAGETLNRAIQICPEDPGLLRSMAEHLTQHGRLNEALDHLVRAQRLAPDDPQLQLSHGALLLELGHVEQAVPELQAAHDRRPSHLPTRMALAKAYEQIGDILEAAELVKGVPDGSPRDTLLLAGRVATRAAAKSNHASLAELGLHWLQLAEVKAENDPDAAYWLAEALRLASRGEDAMAAYQACLAAAKTGPSDLKLRTSLGLAQAAIDVGQTAVGISVLEDLRAEGNPSAASLVLLSKAYRKAGLADEALSPALEAVRIDPECSEARTEAVEVAIQAKAWDAALEQINHWVQSAPEEPEAWTQKARVHALNSDSTGARSALARALQIGSSQPHVILSIGQTLAKLGEQTQAVRILRRASHTHPDNQELLRCLAEQADRAGSHAVAYEAYARLSEFEPGNAHLLRQVGESLWKLDRRSEAIGFWQRAQAAHPKNASLTIRLARAHIENAEPDRGLEQFRQAVKLTPDDPQLAVEAAAALTSHGAASEALALLGTTASLVPDNPAVKLALVDAYSLNGDYQQAVNVLEADSSSLSEPSLAVQSRLSLALSRLGRHDEAQSAYSAVRGGELATADDAVWAARAALRQGDWPGVQTAVDAGLSDEHATPEHVEILVEMAARLLDAGWLYRQSGDVRRHAPAVQTLTEAEERMPWLERALAAAVPTEKITRLQAHLALAGGTMQSDEAVDAYQDPGWLDSLAIAYLRQGNPDQVIAVLSKNAGARVSDYGPILAGLAHSQSGRFAQARKAYGAAQPLPVIRPLAVYLTGQAWAAEGKIQEAVNAYNAALAAWPDEAGWHSTLARAYTSIGELDGALPHLQQAVDLEPLNAEFGLSLAKHLQAIGAHDEAEEQFSQILPHYVDHSDVWLQAGYASLAVGHIDEAAHRFEHASKLHPGSPAAHIGSARAAHAAGNTGRAAQHAAQAVELAPEDPEALMAWADMLGFQGKIDKALTVYERAGSLMVDPERGRSGPQSVVSEEWSAGSGCARAEKGRRKPAG